MEEELSSILTTLNIKSKIINQGPFTIQLTNYKDKELILILSGIGKVNAAIASQYLIDKFSPNFIINVGVAGNLTDYLTFGDVVIASDLVQHDMDATAFGDPLGQIPRMDVFAFHSDSRLVNKCINISQNNMFKKIVGRIISGDQFIDNHEQVKFLHHTFNALACDMESAAVAQVAHLNKIPFIIIRALSDQAGQNNIKASHSFSELKEMSANRASIIVQQLLSTILVPELL